MKGLYSFASMAALASIACMSPETGDGGGGGGGPAPEVKPAAPPEAKAPEPKPPEAKAPEPKAGKAKVGDKVHIVWASPGHELFGVGMLLRADADAADGLRAAGRARLASKEEVKAASDAKRDVLDFG